MKQAVERLDWKTIRYTAISILAIIFIFSILLIVHSAQEIPLQLQDWISGAVRNPVNALGIGWIGAEIILSGSPIAAIAVGFNKSGLMSGVSTLFMIIGSRIGSAFIVLMVGLLAYLRNRRYHASVRIGTLTFLVTIFTAVPALILGWALLKTGLANLIILEPFFAYTTAVHNVTNIVTGSIIRFTGPVFSLIIGLLLLIGALHFLNDVIPEHTEDKDTLKKFKKPWFAFIAGMLITAVTPSISVSLSILVPLYLKGYFKTKHVIPYILGSNIATFTDTLLVASFLGTQQVSIVTTIMLAQIISTGIIFSFYKPFSILCYKYLEKFGQRKEIFPFLLIFVALPLLLVFL